MARRRAATPPDTRPTPEAILERGQLLDADAGPVAGIPGPGRWLVARYWPTALFSLKMSQATSSVGRSLLVPTMYAIKMALVDAGFRAGLADTACDALLRALVSVDVRIAPPTRAVVTHTFVKVRQEPKRPDLLRPYTANIAYREVVHHRGEWGWAFDLAGGDEQVAEWLVTLLPHINSVGKRGSFVQFVGMRRQIDMPVSFTQPHPQEGFTRPSRWHIALLDELGPEASLAVLSSYSSERAKRDRHRAFVQTVVPLGLVNSGPGFSEYGGEM